MIIAKTVSDLRQQLAAKRTGKIGFVPTMGYLHQGHISLVEIARQHSDVTVASIFVNPTQFNNPEDFEKYPLDLERDRTLLEQAGVDFLFLPSPAEIYGDSKHFQTWVNNDGLSISWEGEQRPGHFRGVCTVVSMLFNIVQPDTAVFGEKDFQQLRIIEQMVKDLHFPIEIMRGATVRESDGLAMSSRNVRLSSEARAASLAISKGLFAAQNAFAGGENSAETLRGIVLNELAEQALITPEYVGCVCEQSLAPLDVIDNDARLLVAAQVDGVRLIDNCAVSS
jgi:pantoate--beta-alanine ligase